MRSPAATDINYKETTPLPSGWRWIQLGDVVESMKNGIYKPASSYADEGLACLRMYNIGEGRIVWRDIKRMRVSRDDARAYELLPGDLLVNRVNSQELVGKSAVVPMHLESCIFESKNIRVRLRRDLAAPEFVSYRLLAAGSQYFSKNAQQVVGMASISQPQIARFPIPLPPLNEQQRIVAEIEKQFTRLEAGVVALRRVQANLKRYRAAVLKAACEGRLVPTDGTPWAECLLGRVVTDIEAGRSFRCEERPPNDQEIVVVKVSAVTWGTYNETESKTCLDRSRFEAKYLVRAGVFFSVAPTRSI